MPLSSSEQTALASLDEQGLIGAVRDLVRIPSITGQEVTAQYWLAQHMRGMGLEVDRENFEAPGLVGTWQREAQIAPAKRLVFNGHIDVVPEGNHANWQHNPWGAELEHGRVFGRGACDMKGGLIA